MEGTITITRQTNSKTGDSIRIGIEDSISGIVFVTLTLSPKQLTLALTGLASRPCTMQLYAIENIGKKRKIKQERVPYKTISHRRFSITEIAAKKEALMPFEIEGWYGNADDLGNYHRGNDEDGYIVTFTRFVNDELAP